MDRLRKKKFLIADVGGTKTRMLLISQKFEPLREEVYLNDKYDKIQEIVERFCKNEEIEKAIFGVAGPVKNGICKMTNLSWNISQKEIEAMNNIGKVFIYNDLELAGHGLDGLSGEDLVIVQKGIKERAQPSILISVGTGLGEVMVCDKKVFASEGGHCDFAASSKEEVLLMQCLQKKYGHVSYERVLSGRGLQDMYAFFSNKRDLTPKEIFSSKEGDCLKVKALFFETLGKETANYSLKTLPKGGVYLSGGIIEKNIDRFMRDAFMRGFYKKGKFGTLLESFPIYIVKKNSLLLKAFKAL